MGWEGGKDNDGNLCPELCPPKCTEEEYFCPGLFESNGCRASSLCVERKMDVNGLTCPEVCPVACSERELRVHGGTDSRGCLIEDSCQGISYFQVLFSNFDSVIIFCD